MTAKVLDIPLLKELANFEPIDPEMIHIELDGTRLHMKEVVFYIMRTTYVHGYPQLRLLTTVTNQREDITHHEMTGLYNPKTGEAMLILSEETAKELLESTT